MGNNLSTFGHFLKEQYILEECQLVDNNLFYRTLIFDKPDILILEII